MNYLHRNMIAHGLVVILIAMLLGIGLLISLVGGLELIPGSIIALEIPGDAGAWARAHVGGILNGLLVVVMALVAQQLQLAEAVTRRLRWMLVGTAYANTLFYLAAIFADNRALTFGDNRFGETSVVAIIGLLPALVFVAVSIIAVLTLAKAAFRDQP